MLITATAMKVILIFGATGMVGQGLLRENLKDASIEKVIMIGRTASNQIHPKLHEIVHADLFDYTEIEAQLTGIDATFFCLGTTSSGKIEAEYTRITRDLTLTAAKALLHVNPKMTFIYVSGDGADSSETSRLMWARVRGQTENELLRLPFNKVFIFRPGVIQPLNEIQSKTTSYRFGYSLMKPVLPVLRYLFPKFITSTELLGRAMLKVAREGYDKPIIKAADIYTLSLST